MAPLTVISNMTKYLTILIGMLFFAGPIYAATLFAFQDDEGTFTLAPLGNAAANTQLMESLELTARLAFGTVVITLLLLIPTVAYIHLVIPGARAWVEFLTLTPLVIPPIVQGVGFLYSMPTWVKATPYSLMFSYAILALPFSYRAIDSAFASIDAKTLFDASKTLGANSVTLIRKVLLPNVATGVFAAIFLTIALVLGEFAYASLLLWDTFPTVLAVAGLSDASTAVALSVISLLGVWLILIGVSSLNRNKHLTRRIGI